MSSSVTRQCSVIFQFLMCSEQLCCERARPGAGRESLMGRILSADPVIGEVADSQSINPYAYAGNRPLSFTEPPLAHGGKPG